MTGGCVVVLGRTGKNFAAGMSGGTAYVLDEDNKLYLNLNKELVSSEVVTDKYDVIQLKELIQKHVAYTNSEKGKKILDNFSEYLPKFKKVIPYDYNRMQMAIVQMEEKGLNAEQAQIEAFLCQHKRLRRTQIMGKPTGFMEYDRVDSEAFDPKERIKNFNEFHTPLSPEKQRTQAARCMDCGVPFCQSGKMLKGMISGCPLNNLIPEWNELLYLGNYKRAYHRLAKTSNFPEFTSRVCPGLCEKACTCGLNGDAVTTKENEKTIIEYAFEHGYVKPKIPAVRTGKKKLP